MASPAAYTGAWRAQSGYMDRALAPNPGVDPAHMRRDLPDDSRAPEGRPRVDAQPMYLTEEPDASYALELDTPGLILDVEPHVHDAGDREVRQPSPMPGAEAGLPSSTAHMMDRGAVRRQTYTNVNVRQYDERYQSPRFQNLPVVGDLTRAVLRGDNSLPENNPNGDGAGGPTREGWIIWRRHNRRMFQDDRTHTERFLRPAHAAAAVQSPPFERGLGNRYTSPFGWNRLTKATAPQHPVQRRTPAQWDEQALTDGSDEPDVEISDWVVG